MALYRTYRPRRFDELVGQESVVRLLQHALDADQLGHALLLSGPRGCGKTTLARLAAKGLNCLAHDKPTSEPCGVCEACLDIDRGRFSDLWELDAASNRGVDDMRALRDRLDTAPVGRAKVFILDEAHMLTREAQNALLKSLEEPPPRCYFVLCTTAPEKLLDTILSRCHRYPIRSASPAQLQVALRRVSAAEKREVDEAALAVMAEAAHGSFRDGLSLLDQLLTGTSGVLDGDTVAQLLGRPPVGLWADALAAVANRDQAQVLAHLARVWEASQQPQAELEALARYLRALLYLQGTGSLPDSVPLPPAVEIQARDCAQKLASHALLAIMEGVERSLSAAAGGMEWRLAVERSMIDACGARADNTVPIAEPAPVLQTPAAQPVAAAPIKSVEKSAAPATADPVVAAPAAEPAAATSAPPKPASAPAAAESTTAPPVQSKALLVKPQPQELPKTSSQTAAALAGAMPALILSLRSMEPEAYLALRTAGVAAEEDSIIIRTETEVSEKQRVALAKVFTQICTTSLPSVRWLITEQTTKSPSGAKRAPSGPVPKPAEVDKLLGALGFTPLNVVEPNADERFAGLEQMAGDSDTLNN